MVSSRLVKAPDVLTILVFCHVVPPSRIRQVKTWADRIVGVTRSRDDPRIMWAWHARPLAWSGGLGCLEGVYGMEMRNDAPAEVVVDARSGTADAVPKSKWRGNLS